MIRSIRSRGAISRIYKSSRHFSSDNSGIVIGRVDGGGNIIVRRAFFSESSGDDGGENGSGRKETISHREALISSSSSLFQQHQLQHHHHHHHYRCIDIHNDNAGVANHAQPSRMIASRSLPNQQSVRHYHQCHLHHHQPRQRHSHHHQLLHQQQQQQHRMHPLTNSPTSYQRRTKVFVSRHNQTLNLTTHSIISFILAHLPHLNNPSSGSGSNSGDDFRITSSHVVLKECPFCSKPTNGKVDNMYKLYISIGGGAYFCHRCGCKGSWYDFKNELSGGFIHESSSSSSSSSSGVHSTSTDSSNSAAVKVNGAGLKRQHSQQQIHDGSNNSNHTTPSPLPMPPKKLNSVYIAKLFDPTNSPTVNPKEYHALKYLTDVRGLKKSVLLKYGVGCAQYNFPSTIKQEGSTNSNTNNSTTEESYSNNNNNSKIGYVSSMCVTFPWLMRASEVAELEELRGSKFVWKPDGDNALAVAGLTDAAAAAAEAATTTKRMTNNEGKHISEMTPLEKHHYRKARKNRTKAMLPQEQVLLKENPPSTNTNNVSEQERDEQELSDADMEEVLYGPYISRRIKVRSVEQKSWQRLDPPGGGFGLFGWHTVPHNASQLIITEGEFDAMAVYQATGRPAVSLPNGCRSFPTELLVLLEKFDTIYLWMDNDGPGREGAEMFARKLGVERCLLVQPSGKRGWNGSNTSDDAAIEAGSATAAPRPTPVPPKDANEALLMKWNLHELLDEARVLPHEKILRFSDLRDQVIHEVVNPEKYRGTVIPSLPGFTSLIKGFRRGEMTVLTGPTGSGKTTFLGQMSLDLAEQGVNVLWGSFEIKNTRLMHKLLQQYMRDILPVGLAEKNISSEDKQQQMLALTALADKFETLPMYFMKFHGGSEVDHVLDAMEYAAYVHDVEHIILDNMQFMISRQTIGKGSSYDKFDMQDIAVEKFRKFATDYNVHVTLVVHPRKEDEGAKLGMSSFFGSAKSTQEADTVLILQSDGKRKFIDVKKNRFDGTLGHVPLYFDRKSGRYSETPEVNAPPRTSIPMGVSALNAAQNQMTGSRASSYQDIRNQHPVM